MASLIARRRRRSSAIAITKARLRLSSSCMHTLTTHSAAPNNCMSGSIGASTAIIMSLMACWQSKGSVIVPTSAVHLSISCTHPQWSHKVTSH